MNSKKFLVFVLLACCEFVLMVGCERKSPESLAVENEIAGVRRILGETSEEIGESINLRNVIKKIGQVPDSIQRAEYLRNLERTILEGSLLGPTYRGREHRSDRFWNLLNALANISVANGMWTSEDALNCKFRAIRRMQSEISNIQREVKSDNGQHGLMSRSKNPVCAGFVGGDIHCQGHFESRLNWEIKEVEIKIDEYREKSKNDDWFIRVTNEFRNVVGRFPRTLEQIKADFKKRCK